jgi:hypothetical protein
VTAQRCVGLFPRLLARVCVRLAALRARVRYRCVAVGRRCCVARVLWVAAAVAGSPCYALVRLVSCAVSHCCSVRADSDCNTVVEVLCVPPGVAALDAAAWCRGWVCDAAPPLCVTTVLTSTLSVQCSGVCSCGAACLGVCVHVTL